MKISIGLSEFDFDAWRPDHGRVFETGVAFDCETAAIDPERDWLTPPYVLGAAFDGNKGVFVRREDVAPFFCQHADLEIVMHHAPFDLAVIDQLAPQVSIYGWVDRNQVCDTQLLHRLLKLAEEGHTARGPGQSTLEACAQEYMGVDLPKQLLDSAGADVRLSYAKWLNRHPNEIDPIYLEYLAKDSVVTLGVYAELIDRLHRVLFRSQETWGYVDEAWLKNQILNWGYQTHHIQLKAAVVLRVIKANGLHVDLGRREQLTSDLATIVEEHRRALRTWGYLPGQPGSGKALQGIFRELEREHPSVTFPKTRSGQYETSRETLEELAEIEPFARTLLAFKSVEKLRSTFLGKMNLRHLHPSFDPLMVTGRTSSFGAINAQNLPCDDRIRSCLIPSPGHVFLDADYTTVELATLAQLVQSQFGIPSMMGDAINQDFDLHRLVAAKVTGMPASEVTSEERSKAKPINFGMPGGMGQEGLRRYAKVSYGIDFTADEIEQFSDSWFELFPEMRSFLAQDSSLGKDLAQHFQLTPLTYFEITGSRDWLRCGLGQEIDPNEILGWMCRKVLLQPNPETQKGMPYTDELIDFCWQRVGAKVAEFSVAHQADISLRRPSRQLARAASQIAERKACFTLTGRLRAKASFCARHNTVFQGLAADGAKLALWQLWRERYRIVNFIHDEVLIEVPADSDLTQHAENIQRIMIDAMRQVVPDIKIKVACCAIDRWYKEAEAIHDPIDGRLLVWSPLEPGQVPCV